MNEDAIRQLVAQDIAAQGGTIGGQDPSVWASGGTSSATNTTASDQTSKSKSLRVSTPTTSRKERSITEEERAALAYKAAQSQGLSVDTWYNDSQAAYTGAKDNYDRLQAKYDELKAQKTQQDNGSMFGSVMAKARSEDVSDETLGKYETALKQAQAQLEKTEAELKSASRYKTDQDNKNKMNERLVQNDYDYGRVYDEAKATSQQLKQQKEAVDALIRSAKSNLFLNPETGEYEQYKGDIGQYRKELDSRSEVLARLLKEAEDFEDYSFRYIGKGLGAKNAIEKGLAEEGRLLAEQTKAGERVLGESDSEGGISLYTKYRGATRQGTHVTEDWPQEAVDRYHLILGRYGQQAAEEYAGQVNLALNQAKQAAGGGNWWNMGTSQAEALGAQANGTKGQKFAAGAGTLAASLTTPIFHAMSYIDKLSAVAAGVPYTGRDFALPSDLVQAAAKGRAGQLNKDYGTLGKEYGFLAGKGWGDAFQLSQSMVQSLAMGHTIGEVGTLAAFFAQAADTAFDEAKARGGSDQYAAGVSLLAGLAEVAGEKLSLENLLKGDTKNVLKFLAKQGFIEGSEEVGTSALNMFFDRVAADLTGDRTEIESQIDQLVRGGMSRQEAEKQVWTEKAKEVAFDFVGGFVSGMGSGGAETAIRGTRNQLWEMRKDSVLGKTNAEGQREGGKTNVSDEALQGLIDRALKRGDIRGAEELAQALQEKSGANEEQEYGPADPRANEKMQGRLERQLNGERVNPREDAEVEGETETKTPPALPEEFKDLNPVVAQQFARYEGRDLEMITRSIMPQAAYRYEQYLRAIGQTEKADLVKRIRTDPNYHYQEQAPAYTDEDDLLQNGPQNAAGQQEAPGGQITQPQMQEAAGTVKPQESAQPNNTLYNVAQNPYGISTNGTESGTMSVPNTQEVNNNAGEQTVRADETEGEPADDRSGEAESGGYASGRAGSQEGQGQSGTDTSTDGGRLRQKRLNEFEESELTDAEETSPPEPQEKADLSDITPGTVVIRKPARNSPAFFAWKLIKAMQLKNAYLVKNASGDAVTSGDGYYDDTTDAVVSEVTDDAEMAVVTVAHEGTHKKIQDKYGNDVANGAYTNRYKLFSSIFFRTFRNAAQAATVMRKAENFILKDLQYESDFASTRAARIYSTTIDLEAQGMDFALASQRATNLVAELEKARALEEFFNYLISEHPVFAKEIGAKLGISQAEIEKLREKAKARYVSEDIYTQDEADAIKTGLEEARQYGGSMANTASQSQTNTSRPGVSPQKRISNSSTSSLSKQELNVTLRTLMNGNQEAIGELSTDALNYAINYTLKKVDPDLDFKEKRRSYNVIANILSGENLSRNGLRRDLDANLISPQFGAADNIMQKGGGRRNQLYDYISAGKLRDMHSSEDVRREHASNEGKEFGRYQTIPSNEERITDREKAVLANALNELDRRGLNIWGYDQRQGESGTTKDFEEKEEEWWEEPEFPDTDRYDQTVGDYSDENDEDIARYEKTQASKDLKKMREGDNWVGAAVGVKPEAKEWGRGAKETAGQKTQGWYDINRRSSLSEREFARQRVMNARAAEDLSFEIQTMEDQAASTREEIEMARRNSPAAKEALGVIDSFLEELNDDIDDLHAIDDMFRDAVHENPNSDMTKQLAAEGTRLASEIESLRRSIDALGRLANDSIANNDSEELKDAEKRLQKQEQKIKSKREHLQELLNKSRGGNTSGALVASRAETAFDSMPDDVIKQIIKNGYVSMDMLQDYYGNADAAYQTMYEFQEHVGESGKTRVPSVHKLTGLEKTALHGILAERKKAGNVTRGYGGIETNDNLPEAVGRQAEPDVADDSYDIESARDIARRAEAGEFDIEGSKSTKHKPSTRQPSANASISERNREAYQESMRTGIELESKAPTPASMDRLNRMFAERLGIENTGNTAISTVSRQHRIKESDTDTADINDPVHGMGTGYRGMQTSRNRDGSLEFRTMYDDALPTRPATDKTRKAIAPPSTAYGSVAQAARSILNSKSSFFDFSKDRPKDIPGKVTNAMGQLHEHVREMMEGEHPVNALMQISNMIHEFENDDDLKVFTSESIQKAVDELNDIYYNQDITNEEKAKRMVENATKTLSLISKRVQLVDRGYHMLKSFVGPRKKRDDTDFWSKYKAMQLNPATLFKAMDGFARDKNGSGYQIAKMIENGTALYTITQALALQKLSAVSGMEGFKEFSEGNAKPFDIDGVKITEQQAVEFIMQVRNLLATEVTGKDGPTNRLNTIEGFSIRDKDGKSTFIERSNDADGTNAEWFASLAEAFENSLSPVAKKYLEAATEILDELGQQASDIRTNLIGTGFDGSINGTYYPITYDNKNGKTNSQQSQPVSLASWPMYQSRTRNVGGYVNIKNASDTLDKYIHWASNFIGYGEVAELLYAMDNTGGRMQNLSSLADDMLGKGYRDYIEKFVNDVNEVPDGQKDNDSIWAKLRRNMAAGALLGNLGVAAKQAASLWSAAGVLSPQALLSTETWFGKYSDAGNMLLQSRKIGTSLDPTISEILHNDSFMGKLMKRTRVSEFMGKATAFVDYRTVKRLFAATVVDTKLSFPGLDQNSELFAQAVEAKFQDVVLQTQPIFVKNARAGYLRSNNELTKAFAMFRTQPTQNLNAIVTAIGEYNALKGTEYGKAAGKKLRNTIIGQTVSAVTFAILSSLVGFVRHAWKKYRDDDDELSWLEVAKRIGLDSVESVANLSVVGGDIAKAIITMATGGEEKEFYDMNTGVISMLGDTLSSVTTFGTNVVKAIQEGKPLAVFNAGRQAADNLLQVGLGIPANTIYRLLNTITMYSADALYALSDGKLGNRANYDDAMKMLDSYIKGNLTEEGAKTQAAKAFRQGQPENLFYELGVLDSFTSPDAKESKGRAWLREKIGSSEETDMSANRRIVNYFLDSGFNNQEIDKGIDTYAAASHYNQFYEILREQGLTPKQSVAKLDAIDANADSKITTDELADYWKIHGHEPKENKLIEALFPAAEGGYRQIKDTKTFDTATRHYKPVVDSGVSAQKAVEIVDGCKNDSGDITQAGIYEYYLGHPGDIKQIQALYYSMGYKENGQPRTWESFLKYQAKQASKKTA